jgi:hypothetical protein
LFSGEVSTENNGGFASVRSKNFDPAWDLGGYEGIRVTLKGEGQRYKLILRTSGAWDAVCYCVSIVPPVCLPDLLDPHLLDPHLLVPHLRLPDLLPVLASAAAQYTGRKHTVPQIFDDHKVIIPGLAGHQCPLHIGPVKPGNRINRPISLVKS